MHSLQTSLFRLLCDGVTDQLSIWHIFQLCSYAKLLLRTEKQKSVFPGGRLTRRVPVSRTDLL